MRLGIFLHFTFNLLCFEEKMNTAVLTYISPDCLLNHYREAALHVNVNVLQNLNYIEILYFKLNCLEQLVLVIPNTAFKG